MSTNETLAGLSNTLVYSAMTVYMIAFVLYAFDLVQGRGRVVRAAAHAPTERSRELVGNAGSQVETPAVTDYDAPVDAGAPRPLARIATALTILGAAVHMGAVVTRGLSVDRVPWGNMYEFSITASAVLIVAYLIVIARKDLRFLGTFITGFTLIMMGMAVIAFYTPASELVPALQSYWLLIHVSIAVVASAVLTLAFALAVLQLMQTWRENRLAGAKSEVMRFLRAIPGSIELENVAYRLAAVGFILWTFTLIAGAIWAEKAWGRYWGWDSKEVWTFVVWVIYAAYLHARATRGWSRTMIAILLIIGFASVVFNFTIVNVFFNGLHAYSGLGSPSS